MNDRREWVEEVIVNMRVLRAYGADVRGTELDRHYLTLISNAAQALQLLLDGVSDDDRAAVRAALVAEGLEADDVEDRDSAGGG